MRQYQYTLAPLLLAALTLTSPPPAYAEDAWNPIDGGLFDNRAKDCKLIMRTLEWLVDHLRVPDCTAVDRTRISSHDLDGWHLADICRYNNARQSITTNAADALRGELDAMSKECWRKEGGPHYDKDIIQPIRGMLLNGVWGWTTSVIREDDGSSLQFDLVMALTTPPRIYVGGITRTFCSASPENTLDPSSTFMQALIRKYGKPEAITRSERKEIEQMLDQARQLVNLQASAAVSGKEQARLEENQQRLRNLEIMATYAKVKDEIVGYVWLYDDHHVKIEPLKEDCPGGLPRYKMTLKGSGSKRGLLQDLLEQAKANIKHRADAATKAATQNAPVPRF
jgi:hypothetical protein